MVIAWGLLFCAPNGAAEEFEPGDATVRRTLEWRWSTGWPWWFVPTPAHSGVYEAITGPGFGIRAITAGKAGPLVVWLPHLDGRPDAAEFAVRTLSARGISVAGLIPPGQALAEGMDADAWISLLEERVRSGRAAVREFARERGCLVLVGMSLGALAALPVAALENEVDGLVIMLAGADLAALAETIPHLGQRFARFSLGELSPIQSQRLERLEPTTWASGLERDRILFVRASFDAIISEESSEQLWEALGRPERISYPIGHLSFAFAMPFAVDAIGDHVDKVCAEASSKVGQTHWGWAPTSNLPRSPLYRLNTAVVSFHSLRPPQPIGPRRVVDRFMGAQQVEEAVSD